MIRVDSIWLATAPMDMRAGTETALARVVAVFGAAQPHCAYLFANRRGNRMKVLVHDGLGIWLAARRLHQGRFVWPGNQQGSQLELSPEQLQALVVGRVDQLFVIAGEQVQADQQLISLDNPEWRARLLQLAAMPVNAVPPGQSALGEKERQLLRARVGRAEQRVRALENLVEQGAATRGEVLAAQSDRDGYRSDLLAFERREQLARQSPPGFDREVIAQNSEQQWLKTRLAALSVKAAQSGRIAEVLVNSGENVGAGTLLMRLERLEEPLLWIYLEPLNISYAVIGQPLRVRMPNGDWLLAHVVQAVDSAGRTPTVLRGPFATSEMGLQVAARFDEALPPRWRIDQLPLNVRFPTDWQQMFSASREFIARFESFIAMDRTTTDVPAQSHGKALSAPQKP